MSSVVVCRDHEERWALSHALGVPSELAYRPDVARARAAHPACEPPTAAVVVVRDDEDVAWLRWLRHSSPVPRLPVVALCDGVEAVAAVLGLGVRHVVLLEEDQAAVVDAIERALADAAAQIVDLGGSDLGETVSL